MKLVHLPKEFLDQAFGDIATAVNPDLASNVGCDHSTVTVWIDEMSFTSSPVDKPLVLYRQVVDLLNGVHPYPVSVVKP